MELHASQFSVGVSLVLGALHALEPGHGKTALVAHLLTENKNGWKPLVLAASTAVTHALSIFFAAMVAHGLLHVALDSEANSQVLFQWLNLFSGVILLGTAVFLFRRTRAALKAGAPAVCACGGHHHASGVSRETSQRVRQSSWRTVAIGFAVGLIPCPSALVALSSAILAGHWGVAALVIATFSFGIFISLAVVGMILGLKGSSYLDRMTVLKNNPSLAYRIQGGVILFTGAWHLWIGLNI